MRSWAEERTTAVTALWARVGPRTRDILFIACSIVLASSQILSTGQAPTLLLDPIACSILAALGTAALWWRRSRPVLVAVVGIVLVAVTAIYVVAIIGLFSLAVRRRDRLLVALAVVGALAAMASTSWADGLTIDTVLGVGVVILVAVLGGAYIGVRRDLLDSLREQVAQADAERELRVIQARTAERARIAREMHDVLAHKVSLIALQAGGLEVNPGAGSGSVEETANLIGATARQALTDLREVLGVLRAEASTGGPDLAPQPTVADLPGLIESSRQAGVPIDLQLDDLDPPTIIGRTAYRIVQEALTNVHKHARGAATRIRVTGTEGKTVMVEVHNDAPAAGPDDLPGSGAGLLGLRERVALLGGTLTYGATPAHGWFVQALIPWPAQPSTPYAKVTL